MAGVVETRPATAECWDDVAAVFGRRGDDPAWCWCQRFRRTPSRTPPPEAPDNRAALHGEFLHAAVPPGILAYRSGNPVGWTRVAPVTSLPGVVGNRAIARVLPIDDEGLWWVTCFAVPSRHRGSGVGRALLDAAVDFAREHGATAVLGHPVDVSALQAARVSGASLFTGTMAMFAGAGFVEIARTYPSRPLMRRSF